MELKLFVAVKAFIERDGKVLVLRESLKYADGTNAAKYDVPGGRITPGEILEEALRREVKEETGLDLIDSLPFFADESTPRPIVRGEEWQIIKVFFKCRVKDGEVKISVDHDDFRWIDPKNYQNENLIPNLKLAFERYNNL